MRQVHVALHGSSAFWNLSNLMVPMMQMMAFPFTNRPDQLEHYANITYCANHIQTMAKTWVVDCEHIAALTGYYDPGLTSHWLGRRLQENSCRGLFFWSAKALENSRRVLGRDLPVDKCHVVCPATSSAVNSRHSRDINDTVRICHMTTHRSSHLENISNFYVKGTRDLLLLLKLVSRVLPRLLPRITVVIRAWCPPSYISKLRSQGVNIEMIEQPLSRIEALSVLASSDLALIPCHSTPTMAFIEASSRGVPIITNDVWANSEYVADGVTGLLVQPPAQHRYQDKRLTPLWYRPGFTESLRASADTEYLMRHLRTLQYLIEDENLLVSLKAKTAQYFIDSPFDLTRRNRGLGLLLDEALDQNASSLHL
jgi:glycosyl transferase family 1